MPKDIFSRVLFIGPNYRNHRGGIGALLAVYSGNISNFKFVSSYDGNKGSFGNAFHFVKSLANIVTALIRDRDINIVHIHGASKGSFYRKYLIFFIAKTLFTKKVVYHLHGGKFHLFYKNSTGIQKKLIKNLIEGSDHIFCLSTYWRDFFYREFVVRSVSIVNNAIESPNVSDFQKMDIYPVSFLFFGRVGDNKGIFDLLKLLAEHVEYFQDKLILRIGGNGEIDRLTNYIERHGLRGIVEYVGWVDGEGKDQLLRSCDVLILPSYNEGLPISILEAMSYGKAIVSTNVGGIPEIVKHGHNGYLFNPGDLEALYEILKMIIGDVGRVNRMGEKSKEMIEPYGISNVIRILKETYSQLL